MKPIIIEARAILLDRNDLPPGKRYTPLAAPFTDEQIEELVKEYKFELQAAQQSVRGFVMIAWSTSTIGDDQLREM